MASHPPVNETRSKHTCLNPMYYIKQTPMRLFEDDKPEQSKISVGTKPAISQVNENVLKFFMLNNILFSACWFIACNHK